MQIDLIKFKKDSPAYKLPFFYKIVKLKGIRLLFNFFRVCITYLTFKTFSNIL